ncbi:uncharacterized protein LOC107459590 [Arachis duranensis]|uniref:Uncharacterized protein LOC107459590 n=1 Tax=Arachis duranensis TaxID=130453 RepID=A0A9C6T4V9_ARADU|nr:uncharacterized protein LOC107459590 [Arachis duranensis]
MTWEVMLVSSGFTLDSGVLGGRFQSSSSSLLFLSSLSVSLCSSISLICLSWSGFTANGTRSATSDAAWAICTTQARWWASIAFPCSATVWAAAYGSSTTWSDSERASCSAKAEDSRPVSASSWDASSTWQRRSGVRTSSPRHASSTEPTKPATAVVLNSSCYCWCSEELKIWTLDMCMLQTIL